ncbi:MAG TPA: radical SAM family heme chaperone HemW [Caulobacteraceae bacterium]|nr:radical SAM family heme chaperone HemW [Caulobacteraceae bacterium]
MNDLALYIHWPYCARICPYCDFNVVRAGRDADEPRALADAIIADLEAQAAKIGARRLVSIFFGGGTPSLMAPDDASRMIETAKRLFTPADDLEITLEANPTDAEAARFASFAQAGVQRLSLGVQSLNDASLKTLGRNHDAAEARRAADIAKKAFARLSVDLIYALPDQSPDAWRGELEEALAALEPEHVSPYQLTIEAGTAFARAVARGTLVPPDEDTGADLFEATQDVLSAHGFDAYEVSNHARSDAARSRHNLAIWRGAEYVGVGPGAHGRIVVDGARTATRGARRIADYIGRVGETGLGFDTADVLTGRQVAEERLLLGLRIAEGVPVDALKDLSVAIEAPKVSALRDAGLIEIDATHLRATASGRLVLNRVIEDLIL